MFKLCNISSPWMNERSKGRCKYLKIFSLSSELSLPRFCCRLLRGLIITSISDEKHLRCRYTLYCDVHIRDASMDFRWDCLTQRKSGKSVIHLFSCNGNIITIDPMKRSQPIISSVMNRSSDDMNKITPHSPLHLHIFNQHSSFLMYYLSSRAHI